MSATSSPHRGRANLKPLPWEIRLALFLSEHFNRIHLEVAGVAAGATLTAVLAFSPLYRRWNTALTRHDVLRKAFASSIGAGCVGYAAGRQFQLCIKQHDGSYVTMHHVRNLFKDVVTPEHIASALKSKSKLDWSSRPDDAPSQRAGISERLWTACFWYTTTSTSLQFMRALLERHLNASGISNHDANLTIAYMASGLDGNSLHRIMSTWLLAIMYIARKVSRSHPRSVLYGAPLIPRMLVGLGDFLLLGATATCTFGVDFPSVVLASFIQDKAAVAGFLREKLI